MTDEQRQALDLYKKARRDYEDMQRRLDNYDGNNPDKYRARTRAARQLYEIRKQSLEWAKVSLADADREYEQEREAERQRWASGGQS